MPVCIIQYKSSLFLFSPLLRVKISNGYEICPLMNSAISPLSTCIAMLVFLTLIMIFLPLNLKISIKARRKPLSVG